MNNIRKSLCLLALLGLNMTLAHSQEQPVQKALYDFVVPDNGDFKAALAAADKRTDTTKRFRIFIKKGNYVIPANPKKMVEGTDGKLYPSATTYLSSPNVSIIGEDRDQVVLVNTVPTNYVASKWGQQCPLEGIGRGDVLYLEPTARNTYFQDFTLKSGMPDKTGRNIVLNDNGDKTVCKNMCLWAFQDTYVSHNENSRYYFEGGVLRGRTDFLCGKGDVYYNKVDLLVSDAAYIAVPSVPRKYGYIFQDCVIKDGSAKKDINKRYTLGRPWGMGTPIALFINTTMEVIPSDVGWNEMHGGYPKRFAEYNSHTPDGKLVDLSHRKLGYEAFDKHAKVDDPTTHHMEYNYPVLSKDEAAQYTLERVMGGEDGWNPTVLTHQAPKPQHVVLKGKKLTWADNSQVLLWAVCQNGKVIGFTTKPQFTVKNTKATYAVRAANAMGGLGDPVTAE